MAGKPKFKPIKVKPEDASPGDRGQSGKKAAAAEAKKPVVMEYRPYEGHLRVADSACDDQVGEMAADNGTKGYLRKKSSTTPRALATCGDCEHFNKADNAYLWLCPFWRKPRVFEE